METEIDLGTSPSFRLVHARLAGENEIYSIELSSYDAGIKQSDWINKEILSQKVANIESVELNKLKLIKAEGVWSVAGTKDGEQANAEEINALINKIANIRIDDVLGKDKKENYRLDKPEFTLSMGFANGDSVDYQFSKVEGES